MKHVNRYILQLFVAFIPLLGWGQEAWPSPEVEQMYHNAQQYMHMGNIKDAVTTYRQAIVLAPGKMILYKELGNALFISGNFSGAVQTLTTIIDQPGIDSASFQVLAASYAAMGDTKKATSTLQKGLEHFPHSGLLFHEMGKVHLIEKRPRAALDAWLDGMSNDPVYPLNYLDAARTCTGAGNTVWGLIFGEIFLGVAPDTVNNGEVKELLFAGYKTLFENIAGNKVAPFGKESTTPPPGNFEEAVLQTYESLTPVISDGISTENLVMLRTRFLMDWVPHYRKTYPCTLFFWQDDLIRNGKFETYNEWLFGETESPPEYETWNKFHDGEITRFKKWQATHPLLPTKAECYNNIKAETLLQQSKKRK